MSYLVLARKYRPQTFEQVAQQYHVTRTLANAIEAGRVPHALLFTGPRGTGKTTVARILAKAMNCIQGPTPIPCNTCRSCQEITNGNTVDVFEIDGASNNSVDQVRDLRDNIKYMPAHSRYKIYIIDEVHMLSLAAFNALLKTLEEPPDHILFMFATTEPHKIPITILSRCQRHDMRRIDLDAIVQHMRRLCEQEQVSIDDESLILIAREAGGSMRDALSLLDQILASTQDEVNAQLITDILGVVERKQFFDISAAVFSGEIQTVLAMIDDIWRRGYELKRFYTDLVTHFHHLTIVKLGPRASQLVDLPAHELEQMNAQVADVPQIRLTQIFDLLFQAESSIKFTNLPKPALEMVFIKLFQTPPVLPMDMFIKRLDQLRKELSNIDLPQPPVPAEPVSAVSKAETQRSSAKLSHSDMVSQDSSRTIPETPLPQIDTQTLWQRLREQIPGQKPSLVAALDKCVLKSIDGLQIEIEVQGNDFLLKSITKHTALLEQICSELTGHPMKIQIVANLEVVAAKQKQKQKAARLKHKALEHPLVLEALDLFNGKVVDVKIP